MPKNENKYQIAHSALKYDTKLGWGGFGEVYLGTWQHGDVAIKKIKLDNDSETTRQALAAEAKIMAKLRNQHIVQFFGFCNESPHFAIVMEYMPRGSLCQYLQSPDVIEWQTRIQISSDVGAGLAYLHDHNVLHRDIKSSNILLHKTEEKLHAKLSDFGFSKIKTDLSLANVNQELVGTLAYCAPELHANAAYTKSADVYSFALLLWEIATRQMPFSTAKSEAALIAMSYRGHQEAIHGDVPPLFKNTIEFGRQFLPQHRPEIGNMVDMLKLLLSGYQLEAEDKKQSAPSIQGNHLSVDLTPSPNPHPAKPSGKSVPLPKLFPPKAIPGFIGNSDSISIPLPKKMPVAELKKIKHPRLQEPAKEPEKKVSTPPEKIYPKEYHPSAKEMNLPKKSNIRNMRWNLKFLNAPKLIPTQDRHLNQAKRVYQQGLTLLNKAKFTESLPSLQKAAALHYPPAFLWLGWLCEEGGRIGPKNTDLSMGYYGQAAQAFKWFEDQAKTGDAEARFNLAYCYDNGIGVVPNPQKAFQLYLLAARQQLPVAQNNVGFCYFNGDGVKQNFTKAFKWYRRAAKQDYPIGHLNLGLCYDQGVSVPQNWGKAFNSYMRAGEQGLSDAHYMVGDLFWKDDASYEINSNAMRLYQSAATKGHPMAQYKLALCFRNPHFINNEKTFEWSMQAAQQGLPEGQTLVGFCYENGCGVEINLQRAHDWYEMAAGQGHRDAIECLDLLKLKYETTTPTTLGPRR